MTAVDERTTPAAGLGEPGAVSDAGERRRRVTFRAVLREAARVGQLRETKYGLTPLGLLVLVQVAQNFDSAVLGQLLPEIRRDFGVSLTTLTVVTSLAGTLIFLTSPLVGYVSDRARRTRLVGWSTVLSGIFSTATGAAPSLGTLTLVRSVDDVGEKFGTTPLRSLLADYYPVDSRGKAYAFEDVGTKIGALVAPVTVGWIATAYGWRSPFFVIGPMVTMVGVVILLRLREPVRGYWERRELGATEAVAAVPEPPPTMAEGVRVLLGIRTLRRQAIGLLLLLPATFFYTTLFNFFLLERFGFTPLQRSLLTVPTGVLSIAATFAGGGLTDVLVRRRPSRVLALQAAFGMLGTVGFAVKGVVPVLPVLVLANVLSTVLNGLVAPSQAAVMSLVIPPRMRGLGLSLLGFIVLPTIVLTWIPGVLADSYGIQPAMLLFVPVMFVGNLVLLSAAPFFESDMRAALASSLAAEEYRRAKEAGETKLLVCRDVDVHYGTVQVLFNVDFDVEEGDVVALLGTNGAGKSTLLRAISGINEASNGAIYFDGRDITHLPPYEIARMGVVHMPGGRGVFPGLTVRENLELGLTTCPDDERDGRMARVHEVFPVLADRMDQVAGLLSGGEQQMVALGQAFLARPRLLIIDELSLGLSPAVVAQLLDVVAAIAAQGTTIILVEQSVNVALTVAERAVFMEKGQVRFQGATADLLARPDLVRSVYVKGSSGVTARSPSKPAGASGARPILEVRGLTKRYGGKTAVDGVDLVLHEGEALGVIGPNGAGKTTVFDLVSGYQQADAGSVVLDGIDITSWGPDARARAKLVRRFQDARLFPSLTVFETLCVALEGKLDVRNSFVIATQIPAARRSEARARRGAERLIDLLELGAFRDKFVGDLSTGLRRVVDLACVLATEPKVLLLDEPSSGIAQAEAEGMAPLLRRVRHDTGCSMLVIEHDMGLITAVADELVALVQGRVVVQGPPELVLGHPTVVEAYLGHREETVDRQGRRRR